jgi:hypothetical protein
VLIAQRDFGTAALRFCWPAMNLAGVWWVLARVHLKIKVIVVLNSILQCRSSQRCRQHRFLFGVTLRIRSDEVNGLLGL